VLTFNHKTNYAIVSKIDHTLLLMGVKIKFRQKLHQVCWKCFFVESIQISFNNWERLPLLLAGTLCPPPV